MKKRIISILIGLLMTGVSSNASATGVTASDVICTGCVGDTDIASGAVTTDKVGNGAVTGIKISDGAVLEGKIATGAVSADKIADGAVTSAKVADGSITDVKISGFFSGSWYMIENITSCILTINQVGSAITGSIDSDPIEGRVIGNKVYFKRISNDQRYQGQLFFNLNGKDVLAGIFTTSGQWNNGWHANKQ